MFHRLSMLLMHHARRVICLLTALLVLAGAIGIPLPQHVAKDTSRPFPCMHHACGCSTADSCWEGCCCLTDEQKLAWAHEHGVCPPEALVQAVAKETGGTARGAHKACCHSTGCDDDSEQDGSLSLHVVRLESVRKCQGLTSLWLLLSQALPPAEPADPAEPLLIAWVLPAAAAQLHSPAFDPATPPPRAAL